MRTPHPGSVVNSPGCLAVPDSLSVCAFISGFLSSGSHLKECFYDTVRSKNTIPSMSWGLLGTPCSVNHHMFPHSHRRTPASTALGFLCQCKCFIASCYRVSQTTAPGHEWTATTLTAFSVFALISLSERHQNLDTQSVRSLCACFAGGAVGL